MEGILHEDTEELLQQLRRRRICGPFQTALATLNHLRIVTGRGKWNDVDELLVFVKRLGRVLVKAQPQEMAIASMVGRVLHFIRDCHRAHVEEVVDGGRHRPERSVPGTREIAKANIEKRLDVLRQTSLTDFMLQQEPASTRNTAVEGGMKSELMRMLTDFRDELMSVQEEIEKQAPEYIHDQSVILTLGTSSSVQSFLCAAAAKGLRFHVIVLEGEPLPQRGHALAAVLAKEGIGCTVIPDASLYAIMPRVSQVVVPTRAVMANGGLLAPSGTHTIALAATQFSIPVLCVTGLFKVCPLYPHDLDAFVEFGSPAVLHAGLEEAGISREQSKRVQMWNPLTDYVPPELVTLYVTDQGGHQPSYIYRLLSDFFSHKDADFYSDEV